MINDEENDVQKGLQRATRIKARAFQRLFNTADGKQVLAALKEEFGWDAAAPPTNKEGEISTKKMREWIGCRAVIATILHKISLGEALNGNPQHQHEDE